MPKNTQALNKMSNKYSQLMYPNARRETAIAVILSFLGIQLAGLEINAIQAAVSTTNSFNDEWHSLRTTQTKTWLYLGTFVALILLGLNFAEIRALNNEANIFAKKMVKQYTHKNQISNINDKDLRIIADLILSHMSDNEKAQILEICTKERKNLYTLEFQKLRGEITQQEYGKLCKTHIFRMRDTIMPILRNIEKRNPTLIKLITSFSQGKTKITVPSQFMEHQK